MRVAPELIKSEKYEETSFVLILLNGLNKKFNRNVFTEIEKWFKLGISNWAHADLIGMIILPQFLLNRIIVYTDLESWLTAKNKFQRRTVPISFIKLLNTVNDFTGLFRFLESLMKDPEKEVSQGMGWFLREAWKMKPRETEEFLMKWKDECPKQIIQYATENMDPDKKKIFKKTELAEKKK
jgi:3-methyladenine DNA glycosylase AlkD